MWFTSLREIHLFAGGGSMTLKLPKFHSIETYRNFADTLLLLLFIIDIVHEVYSVDKRIKNKSERFQWLIAVLPK